MTFLVTVRKEPDRCGLREGGRKGLFWLTGGRYTSSYLENHVNRNKRQLVTQGPQFRSRQR